MNHENADNLPDATLQGAMTALRRAAMRAREVAVQSGTDLVVYQNGQIQYLSPEAIHAQLFEGSNPGSTADACRDA